MQRRLSALVSMDIWFLCTLGRLQLPGTFLRERELSICEVKLLAHPLGMCLALADDVFPKPRFLKLFILCKWHACHRACVKVRGQLSGAGTLGPPCGSRGSNSDFGAWLQPLLPTELYHKPSADYLKDPFEYINGTA